MGWALAAGWLTVAGLICLTIGTGAQAWTNLREYRDLLRTATEPARSALEVYLLALALPFYVTIGIAEAGETGQTGTSSSNETSDTSSILPGPIAALAFVLKPLLVIFLTPRKLRAIHHAGGEEAARLAQLLRLATVWSILMAGSVLVLTAAVIQLILAYTS